MKFNLEQKYNQLNLITHEKNMLKFKKSITVTERFKSE